MAEEAEQTLRPLRVLPGGAKAVPEEWYAAAIMGGALVLLWAMRRNLGHDASHVHIGGAAALTYLAYYLIVIGIIRLTAAKVAERSDGPFARALGFYA